MPQQPNPDYVDRCIDFISNRRRRLIADLTLGGVIFAALSAASLYEHYAAAETEPLKNSRPDFVAVNKPCTLGETRAGFHTDLLRRTSEKETCLNS